MEQSQIEVRGAKEHNLKSLDLSIPRGAITVVTGLSGSGKSSLAFDTVLAEAQRRFFYTLSHYTRQFLDLGQRPQVQKISGLSPAIALAQNETQPSLRATVGTLSDVSELLGVLFARFGTTYCPDHDEPTASLSTEQIADHVSQSLPGKTVAICAPLVRDKKGIFKAQMTSFASKGFAKAYVDGEILPLSPVPVLPREEKHTIKIIIDHVKIKPQSRARLLRSVETALEHGNGYGEYYLAGKGGHFDPDVDEGGSFSAKGGCPTCGYSWPRLDSRYFNPNSLGKCPDCLGIGQLREEELEEEGESDLTVPLCPSCGGTGLSDQMRAIRVGGHTLHEYLQMPMDELAELFHSEPWRRRAAENPALKRVLTEVQEKLQRICQVGLGYLNLSRRVRTLSGGESQRLKLAGLLTESLRGILYVLDEPSQGLHPSEMERLWETLENLKDLGNTLLIVDHDEFLMQRADWILDLGPGGGAQGGELVAKFAPKDAKKHVAVSTTAKGLVAKEKANFVFATEKTPRGASFLTLKKPRLHNLKMPSVKFQLGAVNVVTGVSGAGKSSLVLGVLYGNLQANLTGRGRRKKAWQVSHCDDITGGEALEFVTIIDRKPLAKSSVSIPASYLDVFTDLRNLYAKLPAAQIAGLTARSFSLSVDAGRCKECKGRGEITLTMRFLADARVRCQVCGGDRYQSNVLEVRYNGFSMADVLSLTIDEAYQIFKHQRKIAQKLSPAIDLGLGYLKLGQPSASLSGGEAQRLKLVPYLTRKHKEDSVLILDEPTTGLHFEDVTRLMNKLHDIVEGGATVIMIEHNSEVIRRSHWAVDVGPGAADAGGKVVYQGLPSGLLESPHSVTGELLC